MYSLANEIEQQFKNAQNRTEQKKKMREMMKLYGETIQDIENNIPDGMYGEFLMAGGREMLEQVRIENMQQRINSSAPQTPIPTAAKTNPNHTASNEVSMVEKEILDERDRFKELLYGTSKRDISADGTCNRKVTADGTTPIDRNNRKFDKELFMRIMKPIIKKNEGIVLHPYVDTADKSTVGPGINIDSNATGVEWNLLDPKTNKLRPLDPNKKEDKAIIDSELAKLNKYKNGNKKNADFFKDKTNLRITEKNADTLYRRNIEASIQNLNEIITDFNSHLGKQEGYIDPFEKLPETIQTVLIDMVYNLGKTGFNWKITTQTLEDGSKKTYGYPRFWKALAHRDIEGMAAECSRTSLNSRNEEIRSILRETSEFWSQIRLKK